MPRLTALHDFCVGMLTRPRRRRRLRAGRVLHRRDPAGRSCADPTSCARGCTRLPGPRRCAGSGTANARPFPTNCPTPCRTSRARKPWQPVRTRRSGVREPQAACRTATARCSSWPTATVSTDPTSPMRSASARATLTRSCTGCARPSGACPRRTAGVSRRPPSNPTGCAELATILDGWDGQFTRPDAQTHRPAHQACATCDEERRRLVSPAGACSARPRCSSPHRTGCGTARSARLSSTPGPSRSATKGCRSRGRRSAARCFRPPCSSPHWWRRWG